MKKRKKSRPDKLSNSATQACVVLLPLKRSKWFSKNTQGYMGNPTEFILVEKAVRILDFTIG
jgi:hypothetical protein